MQASHRVAMNTGILYVRMGITVFMSLYTTRVILNALGADDFGIFNIVGGAIAMLTFLNSSMAAATQRFMSFAQGEGNSEKQKSIFNVSVVLHAAIALIVLALLEGAGWVLFHGVFKIAADRIGAAQMVYQFAALSTFFTILSVPYDAVINAHENMLLFAILGVLEASLKLGIALFIVHIAGDKLVFYGFWMAGISIFLMLLRLVYCHTRYEECIIAPVAHFRKSIFNEMTSFAGWSFLGAASSLISYTGQGIVLNMFFGTKINAAQGVAGQVTGQLSAFAGTMLKALNPLIAKSEGAGDRKLMLRATLAGSKSGFFLLMLFYVPVWIEMPKVFELWLKHPPAYAVIFCRLLLIRLLIEQLVITLASSICAVGNIKKYQIFTSIFNLFPLPISWLLFRWGFDAKWMYVCYIVYAVVVSMNTVYFASRYFDLSISDYVSNVLVRCFAALSINAAVVVVASRILPETILGLIFVFVISVLAFLISVFGVGVTAEEGKSIGLNIAKIKNRILSSVVG